MRFSSKSGENIGIHMFSALFLEKPVFHFRPSEVSFDLERSANGFLDSENWFLEFGIPYIGFWKVQTGTWVDFERPLEIVRDR